jgi:hypothetical protein
MFVGVCLQATSVAYGASRHVGDDDRRIHREYLRSVGDVDLSQGA